MARHLRKRYDALSTEALWLVVCGSAMTRRRRSCAIPAEALLADAWGSAMARRLRKRSGVTPTEAR